MSKKVATLLGLELVCLGLVSIGARFLPSFRQALLGPFLLVAFGFYSSGYIAARLEKFFGSVQIRLQAHDWRPKVSITILPPELPARREPSRGQEGLHNARPEGD